MHIYQNGGRHLREFWKSVAFSLLLDQSSPNLVGMLRICKRTQRPCWNAYSPEFKMAAAAIFNFENQLLFHYYWTNPHQIWWGCWEYAIERNCLIKNAYLLKFEMATATILNFENWLSFPYMWTEPHQIWWECWEFDKECNCCIKIA